MREKKKRDHLYKGKVSMNPSIIDKAFKVPLHELITMISFPSSTL